MLEEILGTIAIIAAYSLLGMFIWACIFEDFIYRYIDNPLWKLPIFLLWPVSIVGVFIVAVFWALKNYCNEVRECYKEKKEKKK